MTPLAPDQVTGLRFVAPPWMRRARHAVLVRDTLYVSPAMLRLLEGSRGEELMRLLCAIPVRVVT